MLLIPIIGIAIAVTMAAGIGAFMVAVCWYLSTERRKKMQNVEGTWEEYKAAVESSFRHPSCPCEETAIGKEVKAYYEERDKDKVSEEKDEQEKA